MLDECVLEVYGGLESISSFQDLFVVTAGIVSLCDFFLHLLGVVITPELMLLLKQLSKVLLLRGINRVKAIVTLKPQESFLLRQLLLLVPRLLRPVL